MRCRCSLRSTAGSRPADPPSPPCGPGSPGYRSGRRQTAVAHVAGRLERAELTHPLLQALRDRQVLRGDDVPVVPAGAVARGDRDVVDLLVDERPEAVDVRLVDVDVPGLAEEPLHLGLPGHEPSYGSLLSCSPAPAWVGHRVVARCSCTRHTAMEPSPTADRFGIRRLPPPAGHVGRNTFAVMVLAPTETTAPTAPLLSGAGTCVDYSP
jgi:hypothetical protein